MKIGFINSKKYQGVFLIPTIDIDYRDKGLSINLVWWWWFIYFDVKEKKHDAMGNLKKL